MDKAKAFDIIAEKGKMEVDKFVKIYGCANESNLSLYLTEEEVNYIKKCLNAEPDSMDKIIEEFKELGYECKGGDECLAFDNDADETIVINKDGAYKFETIYTDYELDETINEARTITTEELRLVNRLLRLWGVEV